MFSVYGGLDSINPTESCSVNLFLEMSLCSGESCPFLREIIHKSEPQVRRVASLVWKLMHNGKLTQKVESEVLDEIETICLLFIVKK